MASLDQHLVQREARLVQLLDPRSDTSQPSPGYIQGYLPGMRENGGQYTRAAVWAAMAFAALGDADRAWTRLALLNPVTHARDSAQVASCQVEPYVVAGDVYAGRGGWSWYTGSAAGCSSSSSSRCLACTGAGTNYACARSYRRAGGVPK